MKTLYIFIFQLLCIMAKAQSVSVSCPNKILKLNEPFGVVYKIEDHSPCDFNFSLDSAEIKSDELRIIKINTSTAKTIMNGVQTCSQNVSYVFCYRSPGKKKIPNLNFLNSQKHFSCTPCPVIVSNAVISSDDSLAFFEKEILYSDTGLFSMFQLHTEHFNVTASKSHITQKDTLTLTYKLDDSLIYSQVLFPTRYFSSYFKILSKSMDRKDIKSSAGNIQSESVTFTLISVKNGKFNIPPAGVNYNNVWYRTEPLEIFIN